MKKGWKWFWILLGVLVLIVLVLAVMGYREARSLGFLRAPVFETVPEELPLMERPAVLVFSKTNSFIHKDAIPAARQMLQGMARARGWSIHISDNGALYNPEDLARFDVIVWNNVTGDVLLPEQRQAMRKWLEEGGGFVGLHAAGDSSHEAWPWYQDNVIRARMTGHPIDPQFQRATLRVEQPADPIVSGLPQEWVREDEWYSFEASPRAADVGVLLTLDESTYAPGEFFGTPLSMGADHPMIWKHCIGRGRVVYSALGHTGESYAEPGYREVLTRAIAWAGRTEQNPVAGEAAEIATGRPGLACE
ncbi:MAG: ThuA domain-containing protein [Halioglobus sp.]|nr:ThuA domain-containing protein [Halioglobus sp.]